MVILAIFAAVGMCDYGYTTTFLTNKTCCKNKGPQINASVFQSTKDKYSLESRTESFDTDSSTIIVDNSANCVIWRDKKDFLPETYTKLNPELESGIAPSVGSSGSPVGVGHL